MAKSSVQEFLSAIENSLAQTFVKLTLAAYRGPEADLKKIIVKKALIKKQEHLSFTYQYKTRDITKNFPLPEAVRKITVALQDGFTASTLFTTEYDLTYPALKKSKPTTTTPPSLDHDRAKKRLIAAENKAWLHALGISGADGKILASGQDKFRQINKFIETMAPLVSGIKEPRVVDMGAGKGYLTFALYDYLTATLKKPATVTGIEYRQDLVDLCNDIAFTAGFDHLKFEQGTIEQSDIGAANILIALHACDTATDDALAKGITAGVDVIVVAPCCHKQIRREMEKAAIHNDLDILTRHGIFMERQAEMVTDALRTLILEQHGYATKVFEFISDAHTPKNVMIVATKGRKAPGTAEKIAAAKAYFGIKNHHLEQVLATA